MTSTTQNAPTLASLEKEMGKLGTAYAIGHGTRVAAFTKTVDFCTNVEVKEDQADDLWRKFQAAAATAKGRQYIEEKSFKVQVSKYRTAIKLGNLTQIDPVDVVDRTLERVRASGADEMKDTAYDKLVAVAREQLKSPDTALTDEQIDAILAPKQKQDADAIEPLLKAYKNAVKAHAAFPIPEVEAAIQSIADAITATGNEVPELPEVAKTATPEEQVSGARVAALMDRRYKLQALRAAQRALEQEAA